MIARRYQVIKLYIIFTWTQSIYILIRKRIKLMTYRQVCVSSMLFIQPTSWYRHKTVLHALLANKKLVALFCWKDMLCPSQQHTENWRYVMVTGKRFMTDVVHGKPMYVWSPWFYKYPILWRHIVHNSRPILQLKLTLEYIGNGPLT